MFVLIFHSQGQKLVWENYFGKDNWDLSRGICKKNNSFYLVGGSGSPAYFNITKINSVGDTVWYKDYNQTINGGGGITSIVNHRGNLLVFIHSNSNSGVVEIDTNGHFLWHKEYNTSIDENNGQMTLLPDGSAIFMGDRGNYSTGPVYTYAIRIDHNGDIIWDKIYTSIPNATGIHVAPMRNGGFILSGRTGLIGDNQIFQVQIDVNGDTINTSKVFTGESDHDNFNARIIQTSDHGFLIAADINSSVDSLFVMKTDSNFTKEWYFKREGITPKDPTEMSDGSFVTVGTTNFSRGILIKLNQNGGVITNKTYKSISNQNGLSFRAIEFDGEGDAIVAGTFDVGSPDYDEFYYAKMDSVGIPLALNKDCIPPTIHSLTAEWNGDTIILNDSSTVTLQYNQEVYKHWHFQNGSESFWDSVSLVFDQNQYPDSFWVSLVVSDGIYCTDTLTINVFNNEIIENPLGIRKIEETKTLVENLNIYPNPATNEFFVTLPNRSNRVELKMINAIGTVLNPDFKIQADRISISTSLLPKGMYYLHLQNETRIIGIGKIIVE